MRKISPFLTHHAARLLAIGLLLLLYQLTRLPTLTQAESLALATTFAFEAHALPELAERPAARIRRVHPSLEPIAGWISSVGAGVALADLDGDGLPNDLCQVDPRRDQVLVAPAPTSTARYEPFELTPGTLPYDSRTMAPMGCLPADLNEDGWQDLVVYFWGRTPLVYLSRGAGALAATHYQPQELLPGGERWFTNAATQADLDGDGHIDLVFGNYFADGARILDAAADGQESMQHSMSRAFNGGGSYFLLWQGATRAPQPSVDFALSQAALPEAVSRGWTLAVGSADLDGDLLPEIYFANDFGPDRLLHNRSTPGELRFALLHGSRTFTTPRSKILGHDSFKGMGVDFSDLNGDGWLDIYVSNIAAEYALEESHLVYLSQGDVAAALATGHAPYKDQSEPLGLSRSGWGWDVKTADFNNDGRLEAIQATGFVKGRTNRWPELHELAMGNDELLRFPASWPYFQAGDDLSGHQPNAFFVQDEAGRYHDLAAALGLDEPMVTRGIAVADIDGDGALDFALANQWERSYLYRNRCTSCATFLGLRLRLGQGTATTTQAGRPAGVTGRPAIGATARVTLPDGRVLVGQVDGGNGHSGKRSPELHFGLGELAAQSPLAVEVRWRDLAGQPHTSHFSLSPGWHTIDLVP